MAARKCRYCGRTSCSEKDTFEVRKHKTLWTIFVGKTKTMVFGSISRKEAKELADKLETLVAEAFKR